MNRREILKAVGCCAASSVWPLQAVGATDYPARPVRLLVGFPQNGPVDIAGRLIAGWLGERLGQAFAVENEVGDSGNVATRAAVRSTPDGYTLLVFGPVNTINTTLFPDLDFDFGRDIEPIAGLYRVPLVVEVGPSVPVKSAPGFLQYAAQNPGKLKVGYAGKGTPQHVGIALFKWMAKVDLTLVPFTGSASALQALLAGEVDVMFDPLPSSIGLIRDGQVKALAVTSPNRIMALPDLPAMAEFVPGYEAGSWFGLGAPRGTPAEITGKLAAAVDDALAAPAILQKVEAMGGTPMRMSPRQLEAFIAEETARFREVIRAAAITR